MRHERGWQEKIAARTARRLQANLRRAAEVAGCAPPADTECPRCHGRGWNDEWKAVSGHYMGGEVFRVQCDACEGKGMADTTACGCREGTCEGKPTGCRMAAEVARRDPKAM
jgi:DnaJ-class molecular chaperone